MFYDRSLGDLEGELYQVNYALENFESYYGFYDGVPEDLASVARELRHNLKVQKIRLERRVDFLKHPKIIWRAKND